jgi:hypothetical protein
MGRKGALLRLSSLGQFVTAVGSPADEPRIWLRAGTKSPGDRPYMYSSGSISNRQQRGISLREGLEHALVAEFLTVQKRLPPLHEEPVIRVRVRPAG